jgi:hypothetical protein
MLPTGDTTTAVPVQKTSSAPSSSSIVIGRSSTWKIFCNGQWEKKAKTFTCQMPSIQIQHEQKDAYACCVTWNPRFWEISITLLLVIPGRIVPVNSGVEITLSCQEKVMTALIPSMHFVEILNLIANLCNNCRHLNRVVTIEDSMHRTFSSLLTEHHQNAHCIIVKCMTSRLHRYT